MAAKLNVGFIGVGALASRQHLPNAAHNPRFVVHSLCDLDAARLKMYAGKYRAQKSSTDYRTLRDDPDIAMVVIAVQPDQHAALATEFLRAGKHVYVEKPLAEDAAVALQVAKVAEETGRRLAVGFNRRFAPAYLELQSLLRNDRGPIMINYRMIDDDRDRPGWYVDRPRMLDEACHVFDIFNWLAGARPAGIFATEYGRAGDSQVIVEYPNGVTAALAISSHGAFQWPKERIEVVGDNKVVAVEDFVELQTGGIPGFTSKNYAGREYDGYSHGYAKAYEELGIGFYRLMRRQLGDLLLGSGLIEAYPNREKWELFAEKFPGQICFPINYSCDKGWYAALDDFGRCIQEGATPRNATATDSAYTTAMSVAAMESLRRRAPVPVSPPA